MKKEFIRYGFLTVIVLLISTFIYPTIYRYDKYDQKIPVRINRITGKTEMLNYDGWLVVGIKKESKELETSVTTTPMPTTEPDATYNGETFKQYYDRVIKEMPGDTAPKKNTLYYRWERVRLGLDDNLVDPKNYFTIGSTKEDVKKVMGPPDSINNYFDRWDYGSSTVTFENGKVKEYGDSLNKLLVR